MTLCVRNSSNSTIKFIDDTVVIDLITNNDEKTYLKEVGDVPLWYTRLLLNVSKTK